MRQSLKLSNMKQQIKYDVVPLAKEKEFLQYMFDRLVETAGNYKIEINIGRSKLQ